MISTYVQVDFREMGQNSPSFEEEVFFSPNRQNFSISSSW